MNMHARAVFLSIMLASIAGQAPTPVWAQTAPAAQEPAPKGSHRHKTPNLEMDTKGSNDAEAAGPDTSTSDIGTGDRSGSDGATVALPPPPPLLTPAAPAPGAPQPALQPGGISTPPR